MSDRLKGKRAFVTAAAVGIGRACAVAFAREGATVFATDIDETKLAALKSEGIAEVARLDARDSAAVAAMAKRAGKTDILLNAAGFVHHGTVLECSDEDWDFSFDLNVKSMHRTIRRLQGCTEPLRLWRDQGCCCGTHALGRHRLHYQRRALQLHLPRHHRDALDAATGGSGGPRRARDVRLAATDGPARHRRGNRSPCRLSRQR